MANKRMFTMKIVDSDAFLEMPLSAQCLYFHMNMRADDDGFVGNSNRIMRLVGASPDDLKLLIAKRFVLCFEDGVIVIKHWRMHNTLSKNRYHETQYLDEKSMLNLKKNGSYTFSQGEPLDDSRLIAMSQRQSKYIDEQIDEQKTHSDLDLDLGLDKDIDKGIDTRVDYQLIVDMYNDTCVSFPRVISLSDARKKAIKARLRVYSVDDFKKLFEMAEKSDFLKGANGRDWSATFDWLIKDSNMAKVLDGNYDNKDAKEVKSYESESSVRLW